MNKLEQAARQAFETWWQQEGQEFLYALNTTTDDDIKLVAEIAWKNGVYCAEQAEQEPVACGCGATAYCLIRHTNLSEHNFTPICLSCLQKFEQKAQEVNEYEMNNFGGAYGLVTWETKPLYATPVRTKDLTDDEIEECVHIADSECTEDACMPWFVEFARAVIAADREKNK